MSSASKDEGIADRASSQKENSSSGDDDDDDDDDGSYDDDNDDGKGKKGAANDGIPTFNNSTDEERTADAERARGDASTAKSTNMTITLTTHSTGASSSVVSPAGTTTMVGPTGTATLLSPSGTVIVVRPSGGASTVVHWRCESCRVDNMVPTDGTAVPLCEKCGRKHTSYEASRQTRGGWEKARAKVKSGQINIKAGSPLDAKPESSIKKSFHVPMAKMKPEKILLQRQMSQRASSQWPEARNVIAAETRRGTVL